jgi:hypothetical protein
MSVLDTDLLSDLIQRKRSCLVQLCSMGEKQLELVQEGNITQLLELLAVKQHVLVQLQQVERELDRFRGEDPEKRRWSSPEKRQRCAANQTDCERLLARIVVQEKQSEQNLIRRRDEAAARLEGVHTASQARGAYLAPWRPDTGRQLNLVSDGVVS